MNGFIQSAENIFSWLVPGTWVLVMAALVINGALCIVGGDEGRTKAKKALPWVFIGAFLIVGAVTVAKEVVTNIAF